jgi:hypothetical protein
MKATLGLEYFGEGLNAEVKLYSAIMDGAQAGLGRAVTGSTGNRRPWVARITGKDPKYGLRREFLPSNLQRKRQNSNASRGVELWFLLEAGQLYEVKHHVSWRTTDRYFCTATESGEVKRLTTQEAEAWLKNL